jgi:hypothetical protein
MQGIKRGLLVFEGTGAPMLDEEVVGGEIVFELCDIAEDEDLRSTIKEKHNLGLDIASDERSDDIEERSTNPVHVNDV